MKVLEKTNRIKVRGRPYLPLNRNKEVMEEWLDESFWAICKRESYKILEMLNLAAFRLSNNRTKVM